MCGAVQQLDSETWQQFRFLASVEASRERLASGRGQFRELGPGSVRFEGLEGREHLARSFGDLLGLAGACGDLVLCPSLRSDCVKSGWDGGLDTSRWWSGA